MRQNVKSIRTLHNHKPHSRHLKCLFTFVWAFRPPLNGNALKKIDLASLNQNHHELRAVMSHPVSLFLPQTLKTYLIDCFLRFYLSCH